MGEVPELPLEWLCPGRVRADQGPWAAVPRRLGKAPTAGACAAHSPRGVCYSRPSLYGLSWSVHSLGKDCS